jgi:hypothetical protein
LRTPALLFLTILLLAAFAGCAQKPIEHKSKTAVELGAGRNVKTVNRTEIEKVLNRSIAKTGDEKLGDWFVLAASASPESNLTGFRFNIPDGALAPGGFFGGASLSLEVVPIVVGNPADLAAWTLVPLVVDQGRVRIPQERYYSNDPLTRGYILETPRKVADLALPAPSAKDVPPSIEPRFMVVSDDLLRAPGTLFFVVGAKSKAPTEFGIALRLLDHRPQRQEKPSGSLNDFLDNLGRAVPFGLKATGRGQGMVTALYEAGTGLGVSGGQASQTISHDDVRTEDVKVEDRTAVRNVPTFTARDTLISSVSEAPGGWTYVSVYYSAGCATGKYAGKIEANGKTFAPHSVISQHVLCGALYGAIAESLLFGYSVQYQFQAEGPGSSKVSLDLQVVNESVETLHYLHLSFGATMQTLTGHTAAPIQKMNGGLVGNFPPG